MSARIFACMLILVRQREQSVKSVEASIPLLRSFVHAELASLMDKRVNENNTARKKVNFYGVNNSSLITPVDTEKGSELFIENYISSLCKVLREIDKLPQEIKSKNLHIINAILQEFTISSSNPLLLVCSEVSNYFFSVIFQYSILTYLVIITTDHA